MLFVPVLPNKKRILLFVPRVGMPLKMVMLRNLKLLLWVHILNSIKRKLNYHLYFVILTDTNYFLYDFILVNSKYGNYFFQTKASMPYGKGVEGIVYDPREDNVDEKHMKKITSPHWTVDPYHHLKNMEQKYDSTESSEETLGLANLFSTNEYKRRFPYVDSMESNEEIISKVPWAVRSMYRSNNDEKYGLRRGRSYNIDNYRNDEKRYRDIDSHDYLKHLVHTDDSIEVARPYYKKHSNYQQSKRYNKPQYDSYGVEEYMNIHNGRYPINEDSYEEIARRYNNDDSIESYRYSNLDKYDQMVLKADHVKVDPRGHKSYKGLNTYPILRRQNAKINYV